MKKIRIGIVGCGTIGSGIVQGLRKELKPFYRLTGLYDIAQGKAEALSQSCPAKVFKKSLRELLKDCDLMVEAVNAQTTRPLIRQALLAKKDVLAMSVGKLLHARDLFSLAARNHCSLLIPSGAIAGVDAIKAGSLVGVRHITLTTRKPLSGFQNTEALKKQGIDLSKISGETILFEGNVNAAVKLFPQNINVAATLALASQAASRLTVRIVTSPEYSRNTHEVEVRGDFGRIFCRTENEVCPDNPKTSYLAVLSAIQTLKQFGQRITIGT